MDCPGAAAVTTTFPACAGCGGTVWGAVVWIGGYPYHAMKEECRRAQPLFADGWPSPAPWTCPRCGTVHAPHSLTCSCRPLSAGANLPEGDFR